ncbi:ATP-grasp domain-containing protein [Aureispira anguillae]|uniref:ATP-grasp domain-containing protein n=1 Tax=Aureispira anguillae TaxID=2864201 RepID=A0A915YB30_9BACT|nr:ATP-grasp domain-containing protein [Aureispira anguillae]BDS09794.1 ATP-grasp domain-containing protein [Aureispira anguillae]
MRLLFCDSGFSPKEVDYLYQEEYQAAKAHQIPCFLISFEALKKQQMDLALQSVPVLPSKSLAIYRGWMLSYELYQQFYQALLAKNIQLINTPEAYRFCHYLPANYTTIKNYTPLSIFKPLASSFDINNFKEALAVFGNHPIIVKDYVKSQKHYWKEACFIPDASDLKQVEKITKRFIELQDVDLNVGIVYRAFVELEPLTTHAISGMPLTKEFRLFVKNGKIIAAANYWDQGDYDLVAPNLIFLKAVIPCIKSNFFSIDIAQQKDGNWIIVELGDGQVSGLPDGIDRFNFYSSLMDC